MRRMEDTYAQHRTGYVCTLCGDHAVVEIEGIYFCATDAIAVMGNEQRNACDEPAAVG
ncbi:MAG: hypothetical protein ABFS21_01380 [Actinomycetota bacterium]